ncbi:MAG: GNAT family N-acetyltransferase [Fimbriimonadaceae bacterium]|nr:GNAT family N-acetyltransferase [Fimbriimonadaceae bacterium]
MAAGDITFRSVPPNDAFGIAAAHALFLEYQKEVGFDVCFQGFAEELASLPGLYSPPKGLLVVAFFGCEEMGCGALRDLGDGIAELKRVYVNPKNRRNRLGRDISSFLIRKARELGYSAVRLETLPQMSSAVKLYDSLGFVRISSYYEQPIANAIYMEKLLS